MSQTAQIELFEPGVFQHTYMYNLRCLTQIINALVISTGLTLGVVELLQLYIYSSCSTAASLFMYYTVHV